MRLLRESWKQENNRCWNWIWVCGFFFYYWDSPTTSTNSRCPCVSSRWDRAQCFVQLPSTRAIWRRKRNAENSRRNSFMLSTPTSGEFCSVSCSARVFLGNHKRRVLWRRTLYLPTRIQRLCHKSNQHPHCHKPQPNHNKDYIKKKERKKRLKCPGWSVEVPGIQVSDLWPQAGAIRYGGGECGGGHG